MSLQSRLDEIKNILESNIPPGALKVMHRATEDLEHSDAVECVLKPGARAPEFALVDQNGNRVSLPELLNVGALVVSFYRGVW